MANRDESPEEIEITDEMIGLFNTSMYKLYKKAKEECQRINLLPAEDNDEDEDMFHENNLPVFNGNYDLSDETEDLIDNLDEYCCEDDLKQQAKGSRFFKLIIVFCKLELKSYLYCFLVNVITLYNS